MRAKMVSLLGLAIIFILIAFVAWMFGARGAAGVAWGIAKFIVPIVVILVIIGGNIRSYLPLDPSSATKSANPHCYTFEQSRRVVQYE